MDWLVEKATELGVASIQPLHTAHSVLRLKADRAEKKQQHWQSIAIAACEQCGRNRIPTIHPVADIAPWLSQSATSAAQRYVLSLAQPAQTLAPPHSATSCPDGMVFLNGPEGGLQAHEEQLALKHGWLPLSLGARILRAETAALAALMQCALPPQPFLPHQAPQ
jgi:16S rRNA (uracil1498-N3)-methyltransferase